MDKQKIYFIGIGGIGVSALARYFAAKGFAVSGSDQSGSDLIAELRSEGIVVHEGHAAKHVPKDAVRVIRSAAIKQDNLEVIEALRRGIPVSSYAEALGELTRQYVTLAIAGAHGKSTTTALLSLMLIKAGLDPTVIVGTRLAEFGGKNMRLGKSRYLVIEADEYDRSFLHYAPAVTAITNVDAEHLDTYGNLSGVVAAFRKYIRSLPDVATAIVNAEDKNSVRAATGASCRVVLFGKAGKLSARWPLKVPGLFNQLNAEAAYQAAKAVGVTKKVAVEAVSTYRGSWRRMEPLTPLGDWAGIAPGALFFSDYAHHPSEIRATVGALRAAHPKRALLVVFEPHQKRRLTDLFTGFVSAFAGAAHVALLPVYVVAGRDVKGGKTAEDLYRAMAKRQSASYLKKIDGVRTLIRDSALRAGTAGITVVFMGAGSIDREARKHFASDLMGKK